MWGVTQALEAGQRFGDYEIVRRIGRGKMGEVYEAIEPGIGRRIALKIFPPGFARESDRGELYIAAMRSVAAGLEHPGVVTIFAVGRQEDIVYCAMSLMPGGNLSEKTLAGIDRDSALRILRDLARALHYAHGKGFLHGDIAPGNVLFHEDGRAVLSDFGAAAALRSAEASKSAQRSVGSPHYMSPELARVGSEVDHRSDLYSLGVLLFEMLTGRVPYTAETPLGVALQHVSQPVPSLPRQYGELQRLLDGLMAKQAKDRIGTAAELIDHIDALNARGSEDQAPSRLPVPPSPEPKPVEFFALSNRAVWIVFAVVAVSLIALAFSRADRDGPDREAVAQAADERSPATEPRSAPAQGREDIGTGLAATPSTEAELTAELPGPGSIADGAPAARELAEPTAELTRSAEPADLDDASAGDISEPTAPVESPGGSTLEGAPALTAGDDDRGPAALNAGTDRDLEQARSVNVDPLPEEVAAPREERPVVLLSEIDTVQEVERPVLDESSTDTAVEVAAAAPPPPLDMEGLLTAADDDLVADRLTQPAGNNAMEKYQAVLAMDPDNPRAQVGLATIERSYLARADADIAAGRFEAAREWLARASLVNPESVDVTSRLFRLPAAPLPPPSSPPSTSPPVGPTNPVRAPDTIVVPPGSFTMGTQSGDPDERPSRRIRLTRAVPVARTEVTVAEFRRFVEDTGYVTVAERDAGCYHWAYSWRRSAEYSWRNPGFAQTDQHPVVCVAYEDARAYADWVSGQSGTRYRLPSEAEWEYIARGGQGAGGPWADEAARACDYANVSDLDRADAHGLESSPTNVFPCRDRAIATAAVGAYAPNPYGVHDILGNASEWVSDCYREGYRGAPQNGAARTEPGCAFRVMRGGNWSSLPEDVRAADRLRVRAAEAFTFSGFRLVREYR